MFDKNLVLIANLGEGKNPEILFLKANTLTTENHGKTWVTFDEYKVFVETKELPTNVMEYKMEELEIVAVTFKGDGTKTFTKITPGFFAPEKEGTTWAHYDKFVEGLKNYAAALKAKEAEVNKVVESLESPAEKEKPKKKTRKKKKKE